jgi:hypothetical protein
MKESINVKKENNFSNSISNIKKQIIATDELIKGKTFKHSDHEVQPLRSKLRTMSMSSNLRGETILMAYSSSLLDIRNNNKHQREMKNADNSSSNYIDLENDLKFEER